MPLARQSYDRVIRSYQIRVKPTSVPEELPVTLANVKAYLRISVSTLDELLTTLIRQATDIVQLYTHRVLITTDFEGYADRKQAWSTWWPGVIEAPAAALFQSPALFEIPHMPLAAFDSLTYITLDGAEIVADPGDYIVDLSSQDLYGRIALKYFATTAPSGQEINAYKLVWSSGYGEDSTSIPTGLQAAVMRITNFLYTNRGDCGCSTDEIIEASGASGFLNLYKAMRI